MIAMAIACNPRLLIADEPTTALDVTIQAQIMDLLVRIQRELNMAMVLITHDLAVVAEVAHRVVVMYAGQIVETGPVPEIFNAPQHPYTAALLDALPERAAPDEPLRTIPGVVPRSVRSPDRLSVESALPLRQRCLPGDRPRPARGAAAAGPLFDPIVARGCTGMSAPANGAALLQATEVSRHYDVSRGLAAGSAIVRGARWRILFFRKEAHPGRRRRVRLRQVDSGASRHHDRAADRRQHPARRPRSVEDHQGGAAGSPPNRADDLPEPVWLA